MVTWAAKARTGHHLARRQVTVADDALVAVLGLQIGMLAEKVSNLGLYRLGTSRINSPKSCAMGLAQSGIRL